MYQYTAHDVAEALRSAKNPNAAIKRFLKRELRSGDPAERYVKELRAVVGAKNPEPLAQLVAKGFEKFNQHLLAIVRQAYSEPLSLIADSVISKYAEQFNSTYERVDNAIRVKDEIAFRRIFQEVAGLFDQGLEDQKLAPAGLMKTVLLSSVFEADVLKELTAVTDQSD